MLEISRHALFERRTCFASHSVLNLIFRITVAFLATNADVNRSILRLNFVSWAEWEPQGVLGAEGTSSILEAEQIVREQDQGRCRNQESEDAGLRGIMSFIILFFHGVPILFWKAEAEGWNKAWRLVAGRCREADMSSSTSENASFAREDCDAFEYFRLDHCSLCHWVFLVCHFVSASRERRLLEYWRAKECFASAETCLQSCGELRWNFWQISTNHVIWEHNASSFAYGIWDKREALETLDMAARLGQDEKTCSGCGKSGQIG